MKIFPITLIKINAKLMKSNNEIENIKWSQTDASDIPLLIFNNNLILIIATVEIVIS